MRKKYNFDKLDQSFHISISSKEKEILDRLEKMGGYRSSRSFFMDMVLKRNSNDNQFIKKEKDIMRTLQQTYDVISEQLTQLATQRATIKRQMDELEVFNAERTNRLTEDNNKKQIELFNDVFCALRQYETDGITDKSVIEGLLRQILNDLNMIEKIGYLTDNQKALVRREIARIMKRIELKDSHLERLSDIICNCDTQQATFIIEKWRKEHEY